MRRLLLSLAFALVGVGAIGAAPVAATSIPPTVKGVQAISVAWGDLAYFYARGGWVSCQILRHDATAAKTALANIKATIFTGNATTWGLTYPSIQLIRSHWTALVASYTAMNTAGVVCPSSTSQRSILTAKAINAVGAKSFSPATGGFQGIGLVLPILYTYRPLTNAKLTPLTNAGTAFATQIGHRASAYLTALRAGPGSWVTPLAAVTLTSGLVRNFVNPFTIFVAYNRAWMAGDRTWATAFLNKYDPAH